MGNTIRFSREGFNKGVNDTMTLRPLRSAMVPVIEKARSAVSGKTGKTGTGRDSDGSRSSDEEKYSRPEIRMTSPRMMIPAAGIQTICTSGTSITLQTTSPNFGGPPRPIRSWRRKSRKTPTGGTSAGTQVSGLE